jgi:hypothetical protein
MAAGILLQPAHGKNPPGIISLLEDSVVDNIVCLEEVPIPDVFALIRRAFAVHPISLAGVVKAGGQFF